VAFSYTTSMGVAVPLRLGSQATAHLHSHPATLAGIRRQTPTSGPLPAKTDNTFEKPRRDGGTRTRGLLLPNQLHPDAEHSLVSPGVAFTWDDARCASPDVAQCPCMLAPTLAPTLPQLQQGGPGLYKRWTQAHEAAVSGMVAGMATRKVTITLDEAQLDQIRSLVQAQAAPSVSGFVQHAVSVALDDVAGWGAMLAEALRETGGALSDDERAWADGVLGTSSRPAA